MIRVGIIGCGKIADAHADRIRRIPGAVLAAACDREELMAKQLHERFGIERYFSDPPAMIKAVRPDVVHITTPPQSHYELGKLCLEAGCHVYMEKPFTLNAKEAEELIALARAKDLKMTVGHDAFFHPAERRMRDLIRKGWLGGVPVHMESHYCYDLSDGYARALTGDKNHWVRKLPGQLLHNIINHGICRIVEHLVGDDPAVTARGFTSPQLRTLNETEIVDELRVIITGTDQTAYFTFSSQMRPTLHQFAVYGPKNGLVADHHHQTCIMLRGAKYVSYLDKFVPPLVFAKQYMANFSQNAGLFLKKDFHMKSGMKFLIESFYGSILDGRPLPIPYRDILLTTRIMDEIFVQVHPVPGNRVKREDAERQAPAMISPQRSDIPALI